MACKAVCKLCDKLVISQAVTFAGGVLPINLPLALITTAASIVS